MHPDAGPRLGANFVVNRELIRSGVSETGPTQRTGDDASDQGSIQCGPTPTWAKVGAAGQRH